MKKLKNIGWLFALLLIVAGCSITKSTEGTSRGGDNPADPNVIEITNPQRLEDFLTRVPGVYIEGNMVRIRGAIGPPLFVVDGIRMGNSFAGIVNTINVYDIESVEVLKSAAETAIYGRGGENGVIVIRTK